MVFRLRVCICFISFFFWRPQAAWGVLVPLPGIKPGPSAAKLWSPNHWTAKEFPILFQRQGKKLPVTILIFHRWTVYSSISGNSQLAYWSPSALQWINTPELPSSNYALFCSFFAELPLACQCCIIFHPLKHLLDFPGGPGVNTPCFPCRGCGTKPAHPSSEGEVLTTGLPGKSQITFFKKKLIFLGV